MSELFYAGIGSRKTPIHLQNIMRHIAGHMAEAGWVLRSGAAEGADQAFEEGHDLVRDGLKEIYLPWPGYRQSDSLLDPQRMPFSDEEMEFTAKFHPNWAACTPSTRKLHARNTRIMLGHQDLHGERVTPVSFVVCWTKGGKHVGGTSQALRIADALEIPIVNFGEAKSTEDLNKLLLGVEALRRGTEELLAQKQQKEQRP